MKIDLMLSQSEIDALQRKAMNAVISEALRAYLKHHTGKDKPLPFYATNGEERYELGTEVGTVVWSAPEDLEKRLTWNGETAGHIRAAIRAYVSPPPILNREPKPIPKEERPPVEVQIQKTALEAAKKEAEKRGIGLEDLIENVCLKYSKKIADLDTGRPKILMCKLPSVTNSTKYLRYKAPSSLWRITGPDSATLSRFISEALDRKYGDWS